MSKRQPSGYAVLLLMCGLMTAGSVVLKAQPPARPAQPATQTAPANRAQLNLPRTDRYGDPLPAGALARLGTLRYRTGGRPNLVAFSPKGDRIAVASSVGARLFDRATGRPIRDFGHTPTLCMAFSPDGKLVAVPILMSDDVGLFSLETGQEVRRLAKHRDAITCVAFSPDGRRLASASYDQAVVVSEVASGKTLYTLKGHNGAVWRVAFSPDGRTLASAELGNTIRLWDAATGVQRHRLPCASPDVIFMPGSQVLLTPSERGMALWDIRTGTKLRTIASEWGAIQTTALAADGKSMALAYGDGKIVLWDLQRDRELRHWQASLGSYTLLAFAPDGKVLASVCRDETIVRLWDPATGQKINPRIGHRGTIVNLTFTADGRTVLSADLERTVCTWDVRHQAQRRQLVIPGRRSALPAFSADRRLVAAVDRNSKPPLIRLTGINGQHVSRVFPRPAEKEGFAQALAFSLDGRLLASGGFNSALLLYDAATGKVMRRLDETTFVFAAGFSPNGRLLATSQGRTARLQSAVRVWDVSTGRVRWQFDKDCTAFGLAFSSDGRFLAAGESGYHGVAVWDMLTGKEVRRFIGPEYTVGVVAFSPDGRLVAAAAQGPDNRLIHVWEMASGGEVRTFAGNLSVATALAFAPDGRTLASGAADAIVLWDMTGKTLGHGRAIRNAADLEACWKDLAAGQPSQALDAVYALTAAPARTVPFLRQHVPPIRAVDAQGLARLVVDLDSSRFRTRERATAALQRAGPSVEPAIRERLQGRLSAEARRRLEQVLASVRQGPDSLRLLRVIQVLEQIDTPDARMVLQSLAQGLPNARLTQEAKAALTRLARP